MCRSKPALRLRKCRAAGGSGKAHPLSAQAKPSRRSGAAKKQKARKKLGGGKRARDRVGHGPAGVVLRAGGETGHVILAQYRAPSRTNDSWITQDAAEDKRQHCRWPARAGNACIHFAFIFVNGPAPRAGRVKL